MLSDAAEERARLEHLVVEMRGTLGEEHLATLSAILDLADRLWAEGRLIAAGKLEKQVVAGRRRALGTAGGGRAQYGHVRLASLRSRFLR